MVTAAELKAQILKVEGVDVDIVQFMAKKRRILNKLRYPDYPYTEKFQGPIDRLINERIVPVLDQEKIVEDEEE